METGFRRLGLTGCGLPPQTATQADFLSWTEASPSPATAQVLSIQRGDANRPQVQIDAREVRESFFWTRSAPCLSTARLNLSGRPPLRVARKRASWHTLAEEAAFANTMVESLLASEQRYDAEVVLVDYALRWEMLTEGVAAEFSSGRGLPALRPFEYFAYAGAWTALGSAVAAGLSPYVAVHWRQESVDPKALPACATALVDQLALLKKDHPELTGVYLATDYPIEALRSLDEGADLAAVRLTAHSLTFTSELTVQHHAAMRTFLVELAARLPELRLTTLAQEQGVALPPALAGHVKAGDTLDVAELDPALVGIVDKLVASRAELFLAGAPTPARAQCGRASSFTLNILRDREDLLREQATQEGQDAGGGFVAGRLWNVASEFARGGR